MINKILRTFQVLIALAALGFGIFCLYIYKKDFGVPYTGSARMDYNWKYYFAELPKEEISVDGRLFSYKVPKLKKDKAVEIVGSDLFELTTDNHKLLCVLWDKRDPASVNLELRKHFNSKDQDSLSNEFMQWLYFDPAVLPERGRDEDYPKLYDIKAEKVAFKQGGEGLLVSFWSKVQERPHVKFLVGIAPGGQAFKVRSLVRHNASEELYRELVFGHWVERKIPDAERDAQSVYFLNKFIETLEFKK